MNANGPRPLHQYIFHTWETTSDQYPKQVSRETFLQAEVCFLVIMTQVTQSRIPVSHLRFLGPSNI